MMPLPIAHHLLTTAAALEARHAHAQLSAARTLLTTATARVRSHADALAADLRAHLSAYDGLPPAVDAWSVLGLDRAEAPHARMLGWLLDPRGSHGAGDTVLRAFLARVGQAGRALDARALEADVQHEVPLAHGRVDLLLTLPGLVVPIEVKVDAVEHDIEVDGVPRRQALAYAVSLRSQAARQAVQARGRQVIGEQPTIVAVLVRPAGNATTGSAPGPKREGGHEVTWLDVEADLATVLRRTRVADAALPVLQSFRYQLLARTGSRAPQWPHIERARLLVDVPAARRERPLELLAAHRLLRATEEG